MTLERLVRAGASPTWSEPEGSSHNESRLGRYQSLTQALFALQKARRPTGASTGCSRKGSALHPNCIFQFAQEKARRPTYASIGSSRKGKASRSNERPLLPQLKCVPCEKATRLTPSPPMASRKTYKRAAAKVSHSPTRPVSNPRANQRARCSDVPCVNVCGCGTRPACRCK